MIKALYIRRWVELTLEIKTDLDLSDFGAGANVPGPVRMAIGWRSSKSRALHGHQR